MHTLVCAQRPRIVCMHEQTLRPSSAATTAPHARPPSHAETHITLSQHAPLPRMTLVRQFRTRRTRASRRCSLHASRATTKTRMRS